jgi:hypothetical protein
MAKRAPQPVSSLQSGPGDTAGASALAGGDPLAPVLSEPPRTLPNGKVNPDHLRWAIRKINDLNVDIATGKAELPRGYNLAQARDLIETEAKLNGYDPRHLMDVRTDAQIYADTTAELMRAPNELFAAPDSLIDEMEREMNKADAHCAELVGGRNAETTKNAKLDAEFARLDAAKKKWLSRLARLRRLRDRARNAFPANTFKGEFHVVSAAHVLRFMVYVGRSSLDSDARVPQVGFHHAVIAAELYQAETGKAYQDLQWIPFDCDGFMAVCPPGHGKTFIAAHWVVLRLSQNPRKTGLIGHAQAAEAEKDLAYVASNFDPGTANGRRVRSLFNLPAVETANSDTFNFADTGDEAKRQPTLKAHGMTAKISGADAHFIWFDDPCDQELAEQETTRKRVFDRMNGTWRTRKRGKAFEITTTTLWHHDDPNCRRIEMARHRKIKLRVCIQRAGGPDQSFAPLWPEVYPASFLKNKYNELRSPRLYAAAYQSNPQPEELRKIKRLAYYLPGSDEHRRFLDACIFHDSLDPTATNREKSDKACHLYAGVGDVVTQKDGASVYERRLRFLDGEEFHANQTEGVAKVCAYAEFHPVHYVHVEVRSGFNASGEMFEARGLDPILHDPKNRKKELRLGDVAPMLDDSMRDRGFPGAVVEFPGMRREDGTIGPDPDSPLAFLEKQILEFGVCADDHGLDACTQLCKHLGPELSVGDGAVTRKVQEAERLHSDPRIARMLAHFGTPKDSRTTAGQEDYEFQLGDN